MCCFCFQAEDGIRYLVRSRGLGDVYKRQLFRALGQGEGFSADFGQVTIEAPAKLLLCSDGLWGTLPEDTLVKSLQAEPLPVGAAWKLVQTANAAGGADNISVIIVDIH